MSELSDWTVTQFELMFAMIAYELFPSETNEYDSHVDAVALLSDIREVPPPSFDQKAPVLFAAMV